MSATDVNGQMFENLLNIIRFLLSGAALPLYR